jgi:hypothetical protein
MKSSGLLQIWIGSLFVCVLGGCAPPSAYHPNPNLTPTISSSPNWKDSLVSSTPTAIPKSVQPLKVSAAKLTAFKTAAAAQMKDPGSVQFRNLKAVINGGNEEGLCGEMNGKNSYGGYVGFTQFYAAEMFYGAKGSLHPETAIAVVWMADKVGYATIAEKCG